MTRLAIVLPVPLRRPLPYLAESRRIRVLVGTRIREARVSKHKQQNELAVALGVSRTSISNIERGRQRVFVDQVYAVAHALGVDVGAILPSVAAAFTQPALTASPDDPLPPAAARVAASVAQQVRESLSAEHGPSTTPSR